MTAVSEGVVHFNPVASEGGVYMCISNVDINLMFLVKEMLYLIFNDSN